MTNADGAKLALDHALSLHRAGDLDTAADAYRELLELEPGNHDALYGLGTVYMQQGDLENAAALLHQVVKAAPGVPEYLFNYACVQKQLGHDFAALDLFEKAAQYEPGSRTIWLAYAQALSKVRNYPAALRAQRRALGLGAGSAADFLSYADLLFMAKRPDEASNAIEMAQQLGTEDPRAFYIAARCARFSGDHETERRLLQSAIERHASYGDAWQLLLDSTSDAELPGLTERCEQLAHDESTSGRDSIVLLYAAGRARERLGDYGLAFEQFVQANSQQFADARARGKAYDKLRNERFVAQMREQFDGQGACATQTHVANQPVFIVGMPRSGTTLVESIVGGLDGVTAGGESEALEFVATRYYNALGLGQAKPARKLLAQDWDELADGYWRLQTAKKCRLTDKMPTNFRHVGLICRMFPDASIIYVRRDPRDVALSIYTRRFADGHAYATDLDSLAHYYWLSQQLMSHWQRIHPDRIIDIEYEQLIAEPETQTRSIAEFCGLEWRPECLEFHQRREASYTFSELQVREPLNAKGIGRWRNYSEALVPFIDACVAQGAQLRDN